MAAPTDGDVPDVTAGIPEIEDEHASLFEVGAGSAPRRCGRLGRLMGAIGNRMEPNRLSIRLFGNVARSPYDDAEVTEVQVQV
ncbi:hypothetical protein [Streptomyces sp. SA15]|uniref:hypothetical protein n=1 Tax=Streptomyces sp. SA15 TaxID=934019 RepID=UPI00117DA584|nr:hypothetical protein [Streptomyces sp. SA15]